MLGREASDLRGSGDIGCFFSLELFDSSLRITTAEGGGTQSDNAGGLLRSGRVMRSPEDAWYINQRDQFKLLEQRSYTISG